jgi:HSP20 family molecular chaperone IbpA
MAAQIERDDEELVRQRRAQLVFEAQVALANAMDQQDGGLGRVARL